MKKIVLYVLLLYPLLASAQGQYLLKGKAGRLNAPSKIYLLDDSWQAKDSSSIVDGTFSFHGKIDIPVKAFLVLDKTGLGLKSLLKTSGLDRLDFYLENGQISVSTSDSIRRAVVQGSVVNREYSNYKSGAAAVQATIDSLEIIDRDFYKTQPDQTEQASHQKLMGQKYDKAFGELAKVQEKFIRANSSSVVSFDMLRFFPNNSAESIALMEDLFQGLSESIRTTEQAKNLLLDMEKAKKTVVGALAPDFAQQEPNGNTVKLSDFRGKYVLLDFWASWCGPCRRENPNLVAVFNRYKDKGFTVLGVSLDSEKTKAAWIKAIADDKLAWTHVSDLKGWYNQAAQLYMVGGIPDNFLISPDGKIIGRSLRGEDLENKLSSIFPGTSNH